MRSKSSLWTIGPCILLVCTCLIVVISGRSITRASVLFRTPSATTGVTPTPTSVPISTPTLTPTPLPSVSASVLNGVAALSATNMWAVGYSQVGMGKKQSLIEHWDGKQWTIILSPNVAGDDTVLTGITAFTTTNLWAVGYYQTNTGAVYTLTEHWNGKQWAIISSPNVNS